MGTQDNMKIINNGNSNIMHASVCRGNGFSGLHGQRLKENMSIDPMLIFVTASACIIMAISYERIILEELLGKQILSAYFCNVTNEILPSVHFHLTSNKGNCHRIYFFEYDDRVY